MIVPLRGQTGCTMCICVCVSGLECSAVSASFTEDEGEYGTDYGFGSYYFQISIEKLYLLSSHTISNSRSILLPYVLSSSL